MSGEVKYDSLPFIDSSGRDCFEAGGGLQTENATNVEIKSDALDHIAVDQKQSFNVFKDKYLDSSSIDFSDKISQSHKSGYVSKSVYEIIAEQAAVETPQQKYQRLQTELKELAEEVQVIKESSNTEGESPVKLAEEVQSLQKQLHDLHLEKVLGSEVVATDGVHSGTWTKNIVDQLETFKTKQSQNKENATNNVVYEMYYRPEHSKFSQTTKIADLEAKLKNLENLVGDGDQKLKNLTGGSGPLNLMEMTESLNAKLSLFEASHINVVTSRLQGLLHSINEVFQKKEAMETLENSTKIDELHKLITSWESVASVVPHLIERLKALNSMNEQASTFCKSMDHLTTSQSETREQLRTQKQTLAQFEKSFEDNFTAIKSNCEALDKRIENLTKRVGTQ